MQLSLPVLLPDDETFQNFMTGDNALLVAHLENLLTPENQSPSITYISGESGSGKSHLLYALCARGGETGCWVSYFDFNQAREWSVDALAGLEGCDIVCLDNVHALTGLHEWQVAVFDLINRVTESGHARLIITGDAGPALLTLELPDLKSRLSWGMSFTVQKLSENDSIAMLINRAKVRGLTLPDEVAQFMLSRGKRDARSLINALNKLDQLSLQQQRKLTIPFVKQALEL
ncbi:DnaA regulatory inactivator Hda [Neptunicella marina]|uniref:DnaA regulatory inactivator Hda n=1 Tax=Neptunicella marina TaxID=2125989 RepID=A0A8J6M6T9_9ALTE|nr:DnaA regulatory inactivator Hda [Neptunicella marina]MBC3767346.1 DnaA regulatory inactivator Hda [Neptunicella marina]